MNQNTPISRRELTGSIFGAVAGVSLAQSAEATQPTTAKVFTHDVKKFGAKGDERTDDTKAFQAAMNAAHSAGGGIVFVPAGSYRINGTLLIPRNVTLQGIFTAPPTVPWSNVQSGSVLLAFAGKGKATGTPFIQLDFNATLKGLAVFYPEQTDTDPPLAYPWTVSSKLSGADNCSIVDVLLVNPYQAVDFGGRHTGRHYIRNLNGQPLYRGLYIDHCLDVGRVENVHFWPFWSASGAAAAFVRKHGKAFIVGRTDWQHFNNCFCISYETGFQFIRCAGPHPAYQGGGNPMVFGGGADMCNRAVHVEELQGHSGARFANSQIYGDIIVEKTNHGPLMFSNCGLFGSVYGGNAVGQASIEGQGRVSFNDCHVHCIDPRNKPRPLIHAKSGRVQVRGCEFIDGHAPRDHVVLEKDVIHANISDNTSRAQFQGSTMHRERPCCAIISARYETLNINGRLPPGVLLRRLRRSIGTAILQRSRARTRVGAAGTAVCPPSQPEDHLHSVGCVVADVNAVAGDGSGRQ